MSGNSIKLNTNTFDSNRVVAIENMEDGDSIILLWLKLRCRAKKDAQGILSFDIGSVILTDDVINAVFRYKGKSIRNALDVLEHYGFINRYPNSIKIIEWWKESRDRNSPEYKKWRSGVFSRDNYTCQKCGAKTGLQAHHIVAWSETEETPKLRYDINNGITLCKECHLKTHGGSWRKWH